jgi:hypothetical protein
LCDLICVFEYYDTSQKYEILPKVLARCLNPVSCNAASTLALKANKASGGVVSKNCAGISLAGGDLSRERASAALEVVVERLVQRLVCGAAMLDPRFSSKFLATLDGIRDRSKVSSALHHYTPTHPHTLQKEAVMTKGKSL